jgi:hypothetical protein
MTRIVSMNRDQLDRRIAEAVAAATRPAPTARRSYRPQRDPETGMIEMVAVDHRPWGSPGTSPAVVAAVGPLRYDRYADDAIEDGRDFAVIGLVKSSEFLAGHADEEALGRFARDFVMIARGQADDTLQDECCLVLDFQTSDRGSRLTFAAYLTCDAVVFSIFDRSTGVHTAAPVAFFYDEGDLGKEEGDFSRTLDDMRDEDAATRRLLAKLRREARPAPVLEMAAFRARRAG